MTITRRDLLWLVTVGTAAQLGIVAGWDRGWLLAVVQTAAVLLMVFVVSLAVVGFVVGLRHPEGGRFEYRWKKASDDDGTDDA